MPKISAGGMGKFSAKQGRSDILGPDGRSSRVSPEVELLLSRKDIAPELIRRAHDRQDEERDLRVLEAYNSFETGLQEILNSPKTGVMQQQADAAQNATNEVNDYFSEEGGKLLDKLPDDEARSRLTALLNSRRKTAINLVAQHQSQEYQNWKDKTARDTIDSVLKSVNLSPDFATLAHGEHLLEGAVLRLYRGSDPEVLNHRLSSAKQAMFAGAIESIGSKDPISALIVASSWQDRFSEEAYAQLVEKLKPLAWNQNLKQEYASLRGLSDEEVAANIEDIVDPAMQQELVEMLRADKFQQEATAKKAKDARLSILNRNLFQQYSDGSLTPEVITDSGLPVQFRQLWRRVIEREDTSGEDGPFIAVVDGITSHTITAEYQIYSLMAVGLGAGDAAMLATLFGVRDNPQAKLIMNCLKDLAEANQQAGGEVEDYATAIRDLLNRILYLLQKGEVFSITAIRNEVSDDYFGKDQQLSRESDSPATDCVKSEKPQTDEDEGLKSRTDADETDECGINDDVFEKSEGSKPDLNGDEADKIKTEA
ncbi:hypothetical protein [Desulfovibrio gilichinskyi]|uniref:Uncharacterized protein n=1 Tax=Desulfovibrio gilichinskyi TaxID=1519643 RepID=A0A1X7EFE9_9BACT|nr:hypothetical protein [Desulfovibrio gilichinskyi]SMF32541.1 hypothetical protein SAMN06295933_2847 [Desulfovibrio gilichinskyi]